MEKDIFYEKDIKKELFELEVECHSLTGELKEYPNNCYAQENWDRRYEVMLRIKKLNNLLANK